MPGRSTIMTKGRLEAFSDGFFAIVITIMVLEMKVPHGADVSDLGPVLPVFFSYVLSFFYLGIYWNNHHHLVTAAGQVNGGIMWANLHLLFWLSLIPFVTGWMGENSFASAPTALYGLVLLLAGLAYLMLQRRIVNTTPTDSALRRALGHDVKGIGSTVLYALGIGLAFVWPIVSGVIYFLVAATWVVPDRRIERALAAMRGD
jgi:TMEM175 potassium channel family protein